MRRRGLIVGATLVASGARAQTPDWPNRPIRLIVPFPPGGPNDIFARLLAPHYAARLGQPVVVENRGGGGGVVATDAAIKAAPDGTTLALTNGGSLVITPHVTASMPYRVPDDLTLVSVATRVPEALVINPRHGLRTLPALVEQAKRQPGRFNIGTAGAGGISHLAAELFKRQAGIEITVAPYRGAAPAVTDLIAGTIDLLFADLPVLLPQIRAGGMTALVMASARRSPALPDVPTTAEAGLPGVVADNWYALVGPARLPGPVLARWSAVAREVSRMPELAATLAAQGAELVWTPPAEFSEFVQRESARWREVAEASGARLD